MNGIKAFEGIDILSCSEGINKFSKLGDRPWGMNSFLS